VVIFRSQKGSTSKILGNTDVVCLPTGPQHLQREFSTVRASASPLNFQRLEIIQLLLTSPSCLPVPSILHSRVS